MAVRLITYDLNRPGQNYPKVLQIIKSYGSWARLSESCYAVRTTSSPAAIRDRLWQVMDDNDDLVVITLTLPWAAHHSREILDWLKTELRQAA